MQKSAKYDPQNPIKSLALSKSKIPQRDTSKDLLEIVSQSNLEFPELSYADKKSLEQKILQLYESANTSAYELLKSKEEELGQTRLEKVR